MKFFIGVDDSGRGPVIGPMLMAGVLVTEEQKKELKKIGCKDSKMLTAEKREKLYGKIQNLVTSYAVVATSPSEIDNRFAVGVNLNKVEAIKTAEIINILIKGVEEKTEINEQIEIIIDCPSPNTSAWQSYLARYINRPKIINLSCEHKADVNYVECSAASILAKVTRDSEIEKIKKEIGHDFGSGYPSDSTTVEFLEKHSGKFKDHGIFRKTWATWQENERKREQKKLDGF
jgi:ribonuclease HII